MADLAKLVVRLEAESTKLQTQLEKSDKRLKRWEKKASSSVSTVKKAFVSLAGVATVGLFTKLVKDSVAAVDKIGKVADTVALTTAEYQKLAFAADLGNVAQSQFNSNMTAFVKRMGEARANTGPLVSFLQKYDQVLLQALKNTKSQSEAFDLMANAIKNAKTETDRAALANAAFSRAGVSMVNVMKDGSAGLDNMRKKAEDLGIVIDEKTVRNAEKANDQLTIMATIIKNKVITQIVKLSPQIIKIGEAFTETIPKITKFIEAISGAETTGNLERRIEGLTQIADRLREKLIVAESPQPFTNKLFRQLIGTDNPEQLQEQLDGVLAQINNYQTKINEIKSGEATREEIDHANYLRNLWERNNASQESNEYSIQQEIEHADRLRALYEKEAQERIKREQRVQDMITTMRGNAWQAAAGFLRLYAGESKAVAIAVIAIEKGLAIAQALQNKAVAITAALKLPPGIAEARIAEIETISNIQIGFIAATGLGQAAQVGSGGGGGSYGGAPTPIETQGERTDGTSQQNEQQGTTYINIDGAFLSDEGIDAFIDQIRDAGDRRDKIIVSRNSRNGQELAA